MSRLKFSEVGQRFYETGVKNCVLYPQSDTGTYPIGVPWNGVTAFTESPSGAEATPLYADDGVYLNLIAAEIFAASIEAFTYPDEFAECDGSAEIANGVFVGQQKRTPFGTCYQTVVGNDLKGNDLGYKLHLVYGATAAPSEKAHSTINESPEALALSWALTTTPVAIPGMKPAASLVIDSTKATPEKMTALENILYGIDGETFSATKTYAIGDYVTYGTGTILTYVCKTAITVAGAWDALKWTEVAAGPRLPFPAEIIALMGTVVG